MTVDNKRTYRPGDMFKYYGTKRNKEIGIFTKYIITYAGNNTIYVIGNNNVRTTWILEYVPDPNHITWEDLRGGIGKHFDRMENYV